MTATTVPRDTTAAAPPQASDRSVAENRLGQTLVAPALLAQGRDTVRPIHSAFATQATNELVTISGRATVSAGQMQSRAFEVALQDTSGGIRIFSRTLDVRVREGDSLVATGHVKRYRGDLELVAMRVTVVPSAPRLIQPREVPIDVGIGQGKPGGNAFQDGDESPAMGLTAREVPQHSPLS